MADVGVLFEYTSVYSRVANTVTPALLLPLYGGTALVNARNAWQVLAAVAFAVVLAVWLIRALKSSHLAANAAGIEVHEVLRTRRYRWGEIDAILAGDRRVWRSMWAVRTLGVRLRNGNVAWFAGLINPRQSDPERNRWVEHAGKTLADLLVSYEPPR